ncbi:MAG: alkaline phosphatase family protein [Verrucomicrobia bacterium]|nr:alkaline phosphatase family protein [Verrucomicrobiota bacterium]
MNENELSRKSARTACRVPFPQVLTALLALASLPPAGAITFDAASSAGAGAVALVSWSHPVGTGADRMLVVGVTTESAPDALATSVTFGGQALTKVPSSRAVQGSPANATELWYLPAPNMGAGTITVNLSSAVSSGNGTSCGAVSLFGVKQGAPEVVKTSATGSGTAYSLAITTLTDGAWLVDVVNNGAANASFTTVASGMTERWDSTGDAQMAGACATREVLTHGPVTDTWTSTGSGTKAQSIAAFAPAPAAKYAIVISVDGLGGTYLTKLFNGTATGGPYSIPNFTRLKNEGASTLAAHCDNDNWETLPNHISIITARPRDGTAGHNWTGNGDPAVGQTIHTNKGSYVAGVFDVAHDNGLKTGMYANKTKFMLFDTYPPSGYLGGGSYNATYGALDTILPDNGRDKVDNTYINTALGDTTVGIVNTFITQQKTASPNQYAFLHINEPDANGHGSGWGSATWNSSVVTVDGMLGKIFKLIEQEVAVMKGTTAVILTADHGNQDNPPTGADRYQVPFFVWGPGVPAGADLYTLNSSIRQVAASYPMTTYTGMQPIRNAEVNNLALDLLGLGEIPGSSFDSAQNLVVTVPTVTLAVAGSPLAEAAGVATVTATLSVPHTQAVTVNLTFTGTATLTSDYTRSGTSIVIAAGSRSGSITLTAVQDAVYENPAETIVVDISTVVNGTESGTQQVTATIADDDPAPAPEISVEQPLGTNLSDGSASIDCGSIDLGSTSGAFTITVKNIGTADLTGLVVSKDGTAAAPPSPSPSRPVPPGR